MSASSRLLHVLEWTSLAGVHLPCTNARLWIMWVFATRGGSSRGSGRRQSAPGRELRGAECGIQMVSEALGVGRSVNDGDEPGPAWMVTRRLRRRWGPAGSGMSCSEDACCDACVVVHIQPTVVVQTGEMMHEYGQNKNSTSGGSGSVCLTIATVPGPGKGHVP